METRVFVYGTLKPGGRYHEAYCRDYLIEVVAAIAPGLLYDFPHLGYPAMTAGKGWVHGFVLTFKDAAVLERMDELEGYNPQRDPEQNEYQRQIMPIFTPTQQPLGQVWLYLMTADRISHCGGVRVESGNWPESDRSESD